MYKIIFPSNDEIEKCCSIGADIFNTEIDDTQFDPTLESCLQTMDIDNNTFVGIRENGKIIASIMIFPTSKSDMNDFLSGKITERELSDRSKKKHSFEALYLMSAIVLPEYRKKGLAKFLLENQIKYFQDKYNITDFYAWWYSEEGKRLGDSLERSLGIEINSIKTF